jgi:hypothetical protein
MKSYTFEYNIHGKKNRSATVELEPCAHCGSEELEVWNTHTPSFAVECECGAEMHGDYFAKSFRKAITSVVKKWNQRTTVLR